MKSNELSYKSLKRYCNPEKLPFETTEELEPISTGIGQERGIKALEFGLNVDVKGITCIWKAQVELEKQCILKNI